MGNKRRLMRAIDDDAVKRALGAQELERRLRERKPVLTMKDTYVLTYTPATIGNEPGGHKDD